MKPSRPTLFRRACAPGGVWTAAILFGLVTLTACSPQGRDAGKSQQDTGEATLDTGDAVLSVMLAWREGEWEESEMIEMVDGDVVGLSYSAAEAKVFAYVWGVVTHATQSIAVTPRIVLASTGEQIAGDQQPEELILEEWSATEGSGWFHKAHAWVDDMKRLDEVSEWCGQYYVPATLSVTVQTEDGRSASDAVEVELFWALDEFCGNDPYPF